MKRTLLFILLLFSTAQVWAKHITGGEIIYEYISSTPTSKTYRITLILFRDQNCFDCAELPTSVTLGIFSNNTNQEVLRRLVNRTSTEVLQTINFPQCISNPPNLNYIAGFYPFTVTLDNNTAGYTTSYITCCRISGISNLPGNAPVNGEGATYASSIPGTNTMPANIADNSPRFEKGLRPGCDRGKDQGVSIERFAECDLGECGDQVDRACSIRTHSDHTPAPRQGQWNRRRQTVPATGHTSGHYRT